MYVFGLDSQKLVDRALFTVRCLSAVVIAAVERGKDQPLFLHLAVG